MNESDNLSSDLRTAIDKRYQKIASRLDSIKCLSQQEAMDLLDINEDQLATKEELHELLVFRFGSKLPRYPLAQFNLREHSIFSVVPAMLVYSGNLDDWGLLDWLTSYQPDVGGKPIDLLQDGGEALGYC